MARSLYFSINRGSKSSKVQVAHLVKYIILEHLKLVSFLSKYPVLYFCCDINYFAIGYNVSQFPGTHCHIMVLGFWPKTSARCKKKSKKYAPKIHTGIKTIVMGIMHIEKKTTHGYIIGVWKIYWTHCILEFAQIPSKLFEPSRRKEHPLNGIIFHHWSPSQLKMDRQL